MVDVLRAGGFVAEIFGLVGFATFIIVSAVVGVRLLLLAQRTRRLPELAIGLNFVLGGWIGYGLLLAAESIRVFPAPFDGWASFTGVTAMSLGCLSVCVFTYRVFRSGERGAYAALCALSVWLALGIAGSWALHIEKAQAGLGNWLGHWGPNVGMLVAYAWSSYEPLRYHGALRRRAAMGLGDPLVANRVLLWGIGTLGSAGAGAVHFVTQLLGIHALPSSLVGVVSTCVLVTACAEWLAFFPPQAYLRRFAAPPR
jgi:hypothetical protein